MNDAARQDENKVLSSSELENELSTLVSRVIIPSFVADKIKEKIEEEEIELTLSQLHQLVEVIKKKMKTQKYSKYVPTNQEENISPSYEEYEEEGDADVDNIFNTIKELTSRIKRMEESKLNDTEGVTEKIVTTDDIVVPEKNNTLNEKEIFSPLNKIPNDPENVVVLMKWLQYLVDKVGKDNLPDVLEYYADIGWLSDDMIANLIDYSEGITEEKKKEGETVKKERLSDLQAKDHIQSLLYIQRLKGKQPDGHFLSRIDRELTKMTKNLGTL